MLQAPEEFIPDRFMEGTPEAAAVNADAWVPFGGGVRACVGEKFAMAVCSLVALTLSDVLIRRTCRISAYAAASSPWSIVYLHLRFSLLHRCNGRKCCELLIRGRLTVCG